MLFHNCKEAYFQRSENRNVNEMLTKFQEALLLNGYVKDDTRLVFRKKKGWHWGYNSFPPVLHVAADADGIHVQYQLERQARVFLRIYAVFCLLFLGLLLAFSVAGQCAWYYCFIPFGLLCFAVLLSNAMFFLNIRYVSRLLKTALKAGDESFDTICEINIRRESHEI